MKQIEEHNLSIRYVVINVLLRSDSEGTGSHRLMSLYAQAGAPGYIVMMSISSSSAPFVFIYFVINRSRDLC